MKKFLDWLKDFVYDSIDYIIMFVIIVSVVVVIGWRLDVLFANDAIDIPNKNIIVSNEDTPPKVDPSDIVETPDDVEVPKDVETPPVVNPEPSTVGKTIEITIPAGSLPSKIGSILESYGLVSNKNDFVAKAQQLKLDTKLKSGNFTIAKNISIEEVLKIITK